MGYEFADRLIELRRQKGLSQEDLAGELGLTRQAVSKWERAESAPDVTNLIALADLYGVTLDELVHGTGPVAEEVEEASETAVAETAEGAETAGGVEERAIVAEAEALIEDAAPPQTAAENAPVNPSPAEAVAKTATGSAAPSTPLPYVEYDADREPTIGERMAAAEWEKQQMGGSPSAYEQVYGQPSQQPAGTTQPATAAPVTITVTPVERPRKRSGLLLAFPYPVLCTVLFLLLGFCFNVWHPAWIIFLTIPFYYWIAALVTRDPMYQASHGAQENRHG